MSTTGRRAAVARRSTPSLRQIVRGALDDALCVSHSMLVYRVIHLLTATPDRAHLGAAGAAIDAVRGIDR